MEERSGPAARGLLWLLAAAVLAAAALRLTGIGYGLPAVFNGDEPHFVNVAVSFGRGSLDPVYFKYPTLWMYVLFAAYGAAYLLWSCFGMLHSLKEFGELFVWEPGIFFLVGRSLAAAFSLAALVPAWLAGRRLGGPFAGLWAVGLLAASPTIVESAHAAKPDCLLLFWSAWAIWAALRYLDDGRARDLALASLFVGLAGSTQFTAAPLAALIPAAWWARRLSGRAPCMGPGGAAACALMAPAGFLLGSPYAALDFPALMRGLSDNWGAYGHGAGSPAGLQVPLNFLNWAGRWSPGGLLLLWGSWRLFKERRETAVLLLLPAAAFCVFFALQAEGAWQRYLLGIHTALAVVAALGVEAAAGVLSREPWKSPAVRWACLAALMLPGALQAWSLDRDWLLPDTRNTAAAWFEANVPADSGVLSDLPAESPPLRMSRALAEEMLRKTLEAGGDRSRYYELMVRSHPGGGWRVYQVVRDPRELHVGAWHARVSAGGRPVLDPGPELREALAAGVEYVVLSSFGAGSGRTPEMRAYVADVEKAGEPAVEFRPEPGRVRGPLIRVYRIGRAR